MNKNANVHWIYREKLEDSFKGKRERWKGINRYVKEFHKRKERIHREKIDRIQREKINLLKANDVEGYLRMVQVECIPLPPTSKKKKKQIFPSSLSDMLSFVDPFTTL